MTRRYGVCVGVMLAFSLCAGEARGQQFIQTGRDTLRSLPGVEVIVEPVDPELQPAGLASETIRANAEMQLRAAGIPVYASQAQNQSPAKPYLYVHLNGLSLDGDGYALLVQVQVRQTLRSLVTGSNVVNAMSWDQQVVVVIPGRSLQPAYGEIRTLVDAFVQDWRAVH